MKYKYTDEQSDALYEEAKAKVSKHPYLAEHMDFIMADWPEGEAHWEWIIQSDIRDIVQWVKEGQR